MNLELINNWLNSNGWTTEFEDESHTHINGTDQSGEYYINIFNCCGDGDIMVRASLGECFNKWGDAFYEQKFKTVDDCINTLAMNLEFKSQIASEIVWTLLEEDEVNGDNEWFNKLIKLYREYKGKI